MSYEVLWQMKNVWHHCVYDRIKRAEFVVFTGVGRFVEYSTACWSRWIPIPIWMVIDGGVSWKTCVYCIHYWAVNKLGNIQVVAS